MASNEKFTSDQVDARWDEAIAFVTAELEQATKRRNQLQQAIRLMRRNRDDGVRWPHQSANSESGS